MLLIKDLELYVIPNAPVGVLEELLVVLALRGGGICLISLLTILMG